MTAPSGEAICLQRRLRRPLRVCERAPPRSRLWTPQLWAVSTFCSRHTHTHTSMNQHRHVRETDLKKIIKQIKTPHEECVRTQPGDTRSPHRRGDCLPARLPVGGEMNLFAWPSSSPLCSTEHKRRARANYLFIWVILTQREPSSSTPQSRLHMTGSGTVYLSAPAMLPAQTPGGQR